MRIRRGDGDVLLPTCLWSRNGEGRRLDEDRPVSFVTYDDTESGWRSVVATGHLEEITKSALNPNVAEAMQRVEIPLVDVYDRHPVELQFRFFRLTPTEVTGKKEARTMD
ncbi:pyridoxamine 5'-phosphate oxidase family protein [Halorussus salinisoli]|uniref:pyridoxamine 5'-phosphate oxidase family protein n=1 Tax=Halorussus salinisoli TaxID=2558242 RepID=UPI002A90DAB3|nr:pyridoxamine 5'-phosphate oxidase family protein [Halorussus salinisoli]